MKNFIFPYIVEKTPIAIITKIIILAIKNPFLNDSGFTGLGERSTGLGNGST